MLGPRQFIAIDNMRRGTFNEQHIVLQDNVCFKVPLRTVIDAGHAVSEIFLLQNRATDQY